MAARLALVIACSLVSGTARAELKAGRDRLTVTIHGINDTVSNYWVQTGETLLRTEEHYAVLFNEGAESQTRVAALKYGAYAKPVLRDVPPDHIFRIDPRDPKAVERVLREIASKPSVSVAVDMPLGYPDVT